MTTDYTDYSETLEDLIALRKMRRTAAGIDLERLNAGERKRRKVQDTSEEVQRANGMIEGTKGGLNKASIVSVLHIDQENTSLMMQGTGKGARVSSRRTTSPGRRTPSTSTSTCESLVFSG